MIDDPRYKKELDRIHNIIEKAKTIGKPQLVHKWISNNTVTVLAMPDGTLESYDSNDKNVRIPEYEGK